MSERQAIVTAKLHHRRPARWKSLRFVPLAIGATALAVGLWTGFARLGVMLPGGIPQIADRHGALMVCGFFGTLISLERAVALGRPFAYAAPAFSAIGVLTLLGGLELVSIVAFLTAGLVLAVASVVILRRQFALYTLILAIASSSWAIGTFAWLAGRPMAEATGWWLAFLVLTIAAERLELSRVILPPRIAQVIFAVAAALVLTGVARGELVSQSAPVLGIGFIACAAWLLVYDLARRTVRLTGQIRFAAVCMLAGHCWLAVAGVQLLVRPLALAVSWYDGVVHAVTIGFALSMVFGHALIILPAVTGFPLRYTSLAYVPLTLLQLSVAMRVAADFPGWTELRAASAILTVVALAGYAVTLTIASIAAPAQPRPQSG